jgi:tetratricopeptide (TPR) repeat protein
MKKISLTLLLALIASVLIVPAAFAQTAQVKGVVKNLEGKPMVGATVEFLSLDTGRKLTFKTDKNGTYFSIGVPSGIYKVTLTSPELQQPYIARAKFQVTLSQETNECDIDLKKDQGAAVQNMSPEEKARLEQAQKEKTKIKGLNDMLAKSQQQQQAGDFQGAIATLTEATNIDPSQDVLWFKLGEVERAYAPKAASPDEKKKLYNDAAEHYKKAIALKPTVGAYYNNMGDALAKSGNVQGAIDAYTQAAQNDPTNAAMYYFNLGAVLTNTGKTDEANAAFDKAIAADPTKADAYYQKGVNLLGKAKLGSDGKMQAPEGTAEAFNKYLELQPDGPNAESAKQLLASIGAKVETTYGKGKATGKKK